MQLRVVLENDLLASNRYSNIQKMIKQILVLAILFFIKLSCYANIDSLEIALDNAKSRTEKVQLLNEIAQKYLLKNPKQAITLCNEGILLKKRNKKDLGLANLYKTKGTAYLYLGEYDSTKFYWKAYIKLVPGGYEKEKADGYNNLGTYFQKVGYSDSSIYYHRKALALRKKLNEPLGIAMSLHNIAALYRKQGNLTEAIDLYNRALNIYRKNGKKKEIADVLVGLGLIHRELKNYMTSIKYFKESLKINESINNMRGIGSLYNNLGVVYLDIKNDSLAEVYFLKSEEISSKLGDNVSNYGVQINLAVIYKRNGEIQKSIIFYEKALRYFEAKKNHENMAIIQNNLGYLYQKTGNDANAIGYFRKALINGKLADMLKVQKNAHKGLSNSLRNVGQFEEALEHFTRYASIQDSIVQTELIEKVAKYQELYESEKRIKEIKELKHSVYVKNTQAYTDRMYRNWLVVLAVLLIVLVLITINRFKLRKKVLLQRARLIEDEKEEFRLKSALVEKEIEIKNRELSTLSINAMNKNEMLHTLSEKLTNLKFKTQEEIEQSVFELEQQIKRSFNLDKDWETFQRHFTNVHPDFFSQLKSKFPKLSSNDLRICAYMKMNLSTKEISTLMHIAPKSTRMNKYRLKKKLNLSDGEDLQEFISREEHFK